MGSAFVEYQLENALQGMFDDRAARIMKGISRIAAKQGGASTIENYQLLGKRALIVLGVTVVVVQTTASIIGFVRSRKNEEQRIERVVRRVLEEERQKEETGA